MNKLSTIIGIAALALAIVVSNTNAQDGPPNPCPGCPPSTNTPPPVYVSPVYTNGELHLIITRTETEVSVLLTNGSLLEDYVLDRSWTLENPAWEQVTQKFETDTNGMALFVFSPTNGSAFFRARVATFVDYATGGSAPGSFACGSYLGYANYYGFEGTWGYNFEPNMTRHALIDGTGNTNNIVTYVGNHGDHGCGTFKVEVVAIGSSGYRASLMFTQSIPSGPQPMRFKGMVDAPAPLAFMTYLVESMSGPGPNAQGFFY